MHSTDTFLAHGEFDPRVYGGMVNPPVFHASTVTFRDYQDMESRAQQLADADSDALWYGRKGTPSVFALQHTLAQLEGGHRSALLSSGLAACVAAISAFTRAGDHILVSDSVYSPARHYITTILARGGVIATFYDPRIGAEIADLFQERTTLVYTESPGSHTFEIQDIPAIAQAAHRRGATVVLDNTWATPLYFKPFDHGVDVSVHAATKYIVGHSDAMMGVITANQKSWPAVREFVFATGQCVGPDDIYLAQRGLRTLSVRLERHFQSGLTVAQWLRRRPEVEMVLHPALAGAPGHELWLRDFKGASGLFSIVLKPVAEPLFRAFVDSLRLFRLGFSWGGFESLVLPFDPRQSRSATQWPFQGRLLRLHVGLEAVEDLIADLEAALTKLRGSDRGTEDQE